MDRRALRFRRHLAACLLLMLVQELHLMSHKRAGEDFRRVRLASAWQQGERFGGDDYNNKFQRLQQAAPGASGQQQAANGPESDSLMMRSSQINDDDEEFDIVAATLHFIGHYLPTLNFNYTILAKEFDNQQLDQDVERYYKQSFAANMSLEQLQLISIKAALRVAPMPIHLSWGYASRAELRQGSLPVQDDARCMAHLGQLSARLDKITSSNVQQPAAGSGSAANSDASGGSLTALPAAAAGSMAAHQASPVENFEAAQLYKSNDLQFLRYLDTFGRAPGDTLRGNMKWYGSYSGCLDTRLRANPQLGGTRRIKFRYCMAALKSAGWSSATGSNHSSYNQQRAANSKWNQMSKAYGVHSKDVQLENYFIRIGVCLPESCDSSALDYQENWHNLEKLIKFNLMKPFNSDRYYLSDLYCLPDNRSPLRTIPLAGKLLILATLGWLGLVVLATTVHLNVERFYTKAVRGIRRKQEERAANKHFETGSSSRSSGSSGSSSIKPADPQHNNEFAERDFLHLKHYWIRLNVYVWDLSRRLVGGVDLIACLSLYSNWLKYTNRLKVAIVELHSEQERRERIGIRNRKLVDEARCAKQAGQTAELPAVNNKARRRLGESNDAALADGRQPEASIEQTTASDEQLFDRELNKRLKAQDDSDELDSENVKRRVDTSSLNALKVIALFWIIAGHCIFYLGSTISDGAILMNYVRDLAGFALANGALYITELFFVITGCLTAYLAFKYNTFVPNNSAATIKQTPRAELPAQAGQEVAQEVEETRERVYLESRIFKIPFWIMICVNRYLRILPTYLLVYSYVKLVSVYVGGRGQLWDYAVSANSMRRECAHESWLPVLTLTTNFIDIYNHCIIGGWYLSADMQFMLMAVPMLLVLARCQRAGRKSQQQQRQQFVAFSKPSQQLTISTANENINNNDNNITSGQQPELVLVNNRNQVRVGKRIVLAYAFIFSVGLFTAILSMIYGIVKSEVDLSYILKFLPHTVAILSRNIAMYTNSVLRLRAFAFGLILGHLLYLYEFKLIRLPKFIQQHGAKVTTIVFTIGFGIMFLPIIYPQDKLIVSHDSTSILMILSASGIDIFLCILIFLLCIGKAPKVVLFLLNSPFWTVLSSLSLCAFLVHTEIIILLTSQLNPPPTVQYSLMLFVFCATLILTYILALALYLSFEMPVSRLIEALMRKYFASTKLVRSDNPSAAGGSGSGSGAKAGSS